MIADYFPIEIAARKLFELADIASKARKGKPSTISPIAFEAVSKFDTIFALERSINGLSPEARLAARLSHLISVRLTFGGLHPPPGSRFNFAPEFYRHLLAEQSLVGSIRWRGNPVTMPTPKPS